MEIDKIVKLIDVESDYGWLIPLLLPFVLWYWSTQKALTDTGLIGQIRAKADAVAAVDEYVKETLPSFPGEPVISVHSKRNGNREARLIVRAMNDEGVINDALAPFVFPGCMAFLFAAWCVAVVLRFTLCKGHRWRRYSSVMVMVGDVVALVWFFGLLRILEAAK